MNRKEALLKLLEGHKIVSYFGYEFELTKHGLVSGEAFVPFPTGNEYTLLGKPGNPSPVGTFEWARYEFEHGREVVSPTGHTYFPNYSGGWDDIMISPKDVAEARWAVQETTATEYESVAPPQLELGPYESF